MMNSKKLLPIVVLLEFIIIVTSVLISGFTLESLQTTTRFSGRLSFLFFSLMFLLIPQNERGERVISDKPYFVFAVVHGIHLIELLAFIYLSHAQLIPIRLLGGFMAYLFIFIMPGVTDRFRTEKIPANVFTKIETVYHYYVWFIFFMAYLPRVLGKLPNAGGTFAEHLVLFIMVLAVLFIRLASGYKMRAARNA
jgi:hypothetical protein